MDGRHRIFPTDFPCTYRDEQLPHLGELGTNAWDSRIDEGIDGVSVALRTRTAISPFEVKKTIALGGEENCLSVDYEIRNIGFAPPERPARTGRSTNPLPGRARH